MQARRPGVPVVYPTRDPIAVEGVLVCRIQRDPEYFDADCYSSCSWNSSVVQSVAIPSGDVVSSPTRRAVSNPS